MLIQNLTIATRGFFLAGIVEAGTMVIAKVARISL
jgi:hypothetical protein